MNQKRILIPVLVALVLVVIACGGSLALTPGASYDGAIDVADKATSGTISFMISEDGSSITDVNLTLQELICEGMTIGRIHDSLGDVQISISNG